MNELIPISTASEGNITVNARDLHAFLENQDHFTTWIQDRIRQCKFIENQDFTTFSEIPEIGRPRKEYVITLDMAKHLSMLERNDRGHQARTYFIQCEKVALTVETPEQLMLRAFEYLKGKVEEQSKKLEEARPAIEFSARHQDATNLMSIRAAAKIMKFKEARLIDCLLRDKLLYRDRQHRLVPYASSQHEKQIFDCVTGESNGHAYVQAKVTTYGIQYLSNRYASELGE